MDASGKSLLLELLAHGYDKASWHGANLTGALRGVNANEAHRSVKGRKSIWEQALHAAYWKQRVINKLAGREKFGRKGSNWPVVPDRPDEQAWKEDQALLDRIHRRLVEVVSDLPLARLDPRTAGMIHGAAFHDIYHAGQIKLLRRLL